MPPSPKNSNLRASKHVMAGFLRPISLPSVTKMYCFEFRGGRGGGYRRNTPNQETTQTLEPSCSTTTPRWKSVSRILIQDS